jgi:hypothetical protein
MLRGSALRAASTRAVSKACSPSRTRNISQIRTSHGCANPTPQSHLPRYQSLLRTTTIHRTSSRTPTHNLTTMATLPSSLPTISHNPITSPVEWRAALTSSSSEHKNSQLLKVLVFKPKVAKTATVVPVVVIARENAESGAGSLAKAAGVKEMRLASEDVLKEFFGQEVNKDSCLLPTTSFLSSKI